jgi:hypothetical protein
MVYFSRGEWLRFVDDLLMSAIEVQDESPTHAEDILWTHINAFSRSPSLPTLEAAIMSGGFHSADGQANFSLSTLEAWLKQRSVVFDSRAQLCRILRDHKARHSVRAFGTKTRNIWHLPIEPCDS